MNWKKPTAAVAIALMLVLAGCSGGTGAGGGASDATTAEDTPTPTETTTTTGAQNETTTTETNSLTDPKKATIVGVVDGDTYKVEFADGTTKTLSLLGVNVPASSPDKVNPSAFGMNDTSDARKYLAKYGSELEKMAKDKVVGSSVEIVYDTNASAKTDANGNRLAYFYADSGYMFNADLLKNGYATTTDTQHEKAEDFGFMKDNAERNDKGVWSYSG